MDKAVSEATAHSLQWESLKWKVNKVYRLSDLSVLSMGEREACGILSSDSETLQMSTLDKSRK